MRKFIAYMAIFIVSVLAAPAIVLMDFTQFLQGDNVNISNTSGLGDITDNSEIEGNDTTSQENPDVEIPTSTDSEALTSQSSSTVGKSRISVYNHTSDKVEEISITDYLIGVVCAEIPPSYEVEAIKAQVVIAHTYMLRTVASEIENPTPELNGAHISTDPAKHQAYYSLEEIKQRYGENFDAYYEKITECVDAVIDKVITYNESPILATFHATSAGVTEDAQNVWGQHVPYLIPTVSPENTDDSGFFTTYNFTIDQVQTIITTNFPDLGLNPDKSAWLSVLTRTTSDYVGTVSISGHVITGQDFREMFELKSANFTISYAEEIFTITTKGYGHGVGLSQTGANLMASGGSTYDVILAHYYPGTVLSEIEQ